MSTEERIARLETNLEKLVGVQGGMMDLLGFTIEGERRLATRQERYEERQQRYEEKQAELREAMHELTDKLNGLIGVVDGFIRRDK